jgi:autotransporter-associated beta strand protein
LLACASRAADYVWTGAADTDFANPANWRVGETVPATAPANDDGAAGDIVILPDPPTANMPVLSANWNLKELRFAGSGWSFSTGSYTNKIGRYGNGFVASNIAGTNVFMGNLRLGSPDTAGPGWNVAGSGVLRVEGTIGRYAQTTGGGTIRKQGSGTLELDTGASMLNSLQIDGGTVTILSGSGALDANKSLTVNNGCYDLNGHNVAVMSLSGTANGTVTNSAETFATLSTSFGGSAIVPHFIAGALHISWGNNGTARTLTLTNSYNTYTGRTTINNGNTVVIRADAPADAPGVFGFSNLPVTLGNPSSSGGGTVGRLATILTDGARRVGRPVSIGTDKGRHVLGTLPSQEGTSTFSGPIMVGLGSLYGSGGDNPHLEIEVGTNAWVDFTGDITNALGFAAGSNYALRNGKVYMLGPGVARLTGDNAYKGGTVVSNGTLLACSATALGLGGAEVAGGTLGGTCTVAGAVSVLPGAALTAGETNTVGALTLAGGLTLEAGSALTFQLAGAQADRVRVTGGDLAVTGPVTVNVETLDEPEPGLYPVLDWSGAASGAPQLSDFALSPAAAGYALVLDGATLSVRVSGASGTVIQIL